MVYFLERKVKVSKTQKTRLERMMESAISIEKILSKLNYDDKNLVVLLLLDSMGLALDRTVREELLA